MLQSASTPSHHLSAYHLTIEYKHLVQYSPSGVYLLPNAHALPKTPSDPWSFDGVIFLRRGLYSNGIFKFRVDVASPSASLGDDVTLPPSEPAAVRSPNVTVTFLGIPVGAAADKSAPSFIFPFNPYIDSSTGRLDLSPITAPLPSSPFKSPAPSSKGGTDGSSPQTIYLITVLTFVKKIFYEKHFPAPTPDRPYANSRAYTRWVAHDSQHQAAHASASVGDDAAPGSSPSPVIPSPPPSQYLVSILAGVTASQECVYFDGVPPPSSSERSRAAGGGWHFTESRPSHEVFKERLLATLPTSASTLEGGGGGGGSDDDDESSHDSRTSSSAGPSTPERGGDKVGAEAKARLNNHVGAKELLDLIKACEDEIGDMTKRSLGE